MTANNLPSLMDFSRHLFHKLDAHWKGDDLGMARLGYSPEEEEAIHIITDAPSVQALNMRHVSDLAGNHYLIYPGASSENGAIMMGSHLDAVPNGGRYDGASGVVSALAAVKSIHDANITPYHDICIPIFRCEEGPAFRRATLGSGFAVGKADESLFSRSQVSTGKTLDVHMQEIGINTTALKQAAQENRALIPLETLVCVVEQHIEQSCTLHDTAADIGVVTALRGYLNYPSRITFTGAPNHTGTAKQETRKDPVRIAGEFIHAVSEQFDQVKSEGNDITFAFPLAATGPMSSSCRIAPDYSLGVEIRSLDPKILEKGERIIAETIQSLSERFSCTIQAGTPALMQPTVMSPEMVQIIRNSADQTNIPAVEVISGAVHDAGTLQREGIPATMILLRHGGNNDGQSHWPGENMVREPGDNPFAVDSPFAQSTRVMAHFIATARFENQRCGNFAQSLLDRHAGQEITLGQ
jgi:N-carbamoyl-L-amino-acid hydrolase